MGGGMSGVRVGLSWARRVVQGQIRVARVEGGMSVGNVGN